MDYRLHTGTARTSPELANSDCPDDFAAEKWARRWASSNEHGDDFFIDREDGNYSALLFRTAAGQWYVMRHQSCQTAPNPAALVVV
jgi:hypothetical protein